MSASPAPNPAPGPARLSVDARRTELLRFGRAHFAEARFDALPMTEIARRAGVSKGLLYHYFGGRHGFYLATVEAVVDEVLEATDPPPGLGLEDALRAMLQRFVDFVRDNGAIYRALIRGGLGSDPEVNLALDRVRTTSIRRLVDRAGVEPTELARVALVGWSSFVEAACAEWLDHPEVEARALVDLLLEASKAALGALEAPGAPTPG